MSIFDTSPPIIDNKTLIQWLMNNYNFFKDEIISIELLNSERDKNFKILTNKNKKFVVKISNCAENYDILCFQDSMIDHLSQSKVKDFIPIKLHNKIKIFKDLKNRDCFIRILSFIEGSVFAKNQSNEIGGYSIIRNRNIPTIK